jgi:acetyltransferase-like isoleucine patch superfamily enzyme
LFTNDLRPRAAIRRTGTDLLPTIVRRGASLGAGVVVVCGVEIGGYGFAAAGAVVTRDVPAHAFVAGNPARHKGWVCACGERLGDNLVCPACGTTHEATGTGGLKAR